MTNSCITQLNLLQHEFFHLRDGNRVAPYLLDIAILVKRAELLPTEDGEREISAGVQGTIRLLCIRTTY